MFANCQLVQRMKAQAAQQSEERRRLLSFCSEVCALGQVCRRKFKSRLIQAATLSEEGRSEVLLESSNERRRASRANCLTY
jgi:hypothetical protein